MALESWRPNFKLGNDSLKHARICVHLPDLPLELWEKKKIMKIASKVGTPLFLDNWIETLVRMGFARVCVLVDISKFIYLGAKIRVDESIVWQQFIYELSKICYYCEVIGCAEDGGGCSMAQAFKTKLVYRP